MVDMSTDTTTLATDRECVEIEAKARATTVMHWPELVRVFNRLRAAETRIAALEGIKLGLEMKIRSLEAPADLDKELDGL
jgi:hypothetical protein